MELIGKISKGSKMDQVYLPKNRVGFNTGQYVIISLLDKKIEESRVNTKQFKPYFYNIKNIEPVKLKIIQEIFNLLDKFKPESIIITGSFLEPGFKFNDLDILIVSEEKIKIDLIKTQIENITGIKAHIILLDNKSLNIGLSSDPLYLMMLNKCISQNRLIFNVKRQINYHLLDLHLLKSKSLIDNFDILSGKEKYYQTMNLVSILLFIQNKKLSKEVINHEITRVFGIKTENILENMIDKPLFIKKYKEIYNKTFNLIMKNLKEKAK
jgi:hypothetical protein